MDKKTVKLVIVVAMLLVIALYFVGGTYARYASEYNGTASLNVAKWATKIKGDEVGENTTLTLNFTTEDNDNVVSGKIAPEVTATAKAEIDLEGTEVAVDVLIAGTQGDLENAISSAVESLGMEAGDISIKAEVTAEGSASSKVQATEEGKKYQIDLPDKSSGFTKGNSIVTISIKVTWKNNDDHNTNDTSAGKTAGTLSVPVKLTVQQHIDEV